MDFFNYENKVATHPSNEIMDISAVNYLSTVLSPRGRIIPNFSKVDKWPNHDGNFEYISNLDISRAPKQNFIVQIKSTYIYKDENDKIKYNLDSLAFPAYIKKEVTSDPAIIFLVTEPEDRIKRKIYWIYLSPKFLNSINFNQKSQTIYFPKENIIEDNDESFFNFCKNLDKICAFHSFINKLDSSSISKDDCIKIIESRSKEIDDRIECLKIDDRDKVSSSLILYLYDLSKSILCLNSCFVIDKNEICEKLAYDIALTNIETRFLSEFVDGLKYINMRIPDEGQAERLMLKYYVYLNKIKKLYKKLLKKDILNRLDAFPIYEDKVDIDYNRNVFNAINNYELTDKNAIVIENKCRYIVQKCKPIIIDGNIFYEITLGVSDIFNKTNKLIVYSTKNVSCAYSIKIKIVELHITLWGIKFYINYLNDWYVSIYPAKLNKLSEILKCNTHLNFDSKEYKKIMQFLKKQG